MQSDNSKKVNDMISMLDSHNEEFVHWTRTSVSTIDVTSSASSSLPTLWKKKDKETCVIYNSKSSTDTSTCT